MKRRMLGAAVLVLLGCSTLAWCRTPTSQPAAPPTPAPQPPAAQPGDSETPAGKVAIQRLNVTGQIEKANITFTLEFDAEAQEANQEIPLIAGQVALWNVEAPAAGYRMRYDAQQRAYYMSWPAKGTRHVKVSFAARAEEAGKDGWRVASFSLPASQVRQIDVACDRSDLEVQFPEAMRVERKTEGGKLVLSAVLGPGKPFIVRFKPQVQKMDAKLVFSSESNTIVSLSAATLRVDSLLLFDVAQGSLQELQFKVPASMSVTQVRGLYIQDWSVAEAKDGKRLKVSLNRPQTRQYVLQVQGEAAAPSLPCDLAVPVIEPQGGLRASGRLAVGTDSALQMQVTRTAALTQIDTKAFPRVVADKDHPRPLPANKVFAYTFAASPYELALHMDNVTPVFDAMYRQTVTVKDEDFTVDAEITLDVREAPLRELVVQTPRGLQVASVAGALVDDYRVDAAREGEAPKVHVQFKQPVMGKTNVTLRLELGHGPLGELQKVQPIRAEGAKTERGYLAVAGEDGLQIDATEPKELRDVNVASLEVIPPDTRLAYRFRQSDWSLSLMAKRKPSAIRTESFHLLSLGEGRAYGSVAIAYFITGSPVDRLQFQLPEALRNVQFVGRDVRRSEHKEGHWTVYLQRRVIGDYNLAMTFELPYEAGGKVPAGEVQCEGVETQTGYIAVTSQLNLELSAEAMDPALLEIAPEELPGNYRLLATAPILKTFKYVSAPHNASLVVKAHEQAEMIPAVVEVMDLTTRLAIRENNRTESVTVARYKVKNTSSQFLTLQMPEGATVWATRLIERREDGTESATRLAASVDEKRGLLVPLPRRRNPNEPVTIELEYGQRHDKPSAWATRILLKAPGSLVPATFAHWTVTAPEDTAIQAGAGGNMAAAPTLGAGHGLAAVLDDVLRAWKQGLMRHPAPPIFVLILMAPVITLSALRFRRTLVDLSVLLAAGLLLLMGWLATETNTFRQLGAVEQATTVQFTRVVNLQEQGSLSAAIVSLPAWRQYLPLSTAVMVPVALVVLAVLGLLVRRLRKVCFAAGVAAAAFGAAYVSPLVVPLGHLLTWGLPLLLVLALLAKRVLPLLRRARLQHAAAAVLLLGLLGLGAGCEGQMGATTVLAEKPTLDHIDYKLSVEKDSLLVRLVATVSTAEPAEFPLMEQSAVLLSSATPKKNVAFVLRDGMHYLQIKAAGAYEVPAEFLHPLVAADATRMQGLVLPAPLALRNTVELTVPEKDVEIAAPTAYRLQQEDGEAATVARAVMPPGQAIAFVWRPRARQTELEQTRFYAQTTSVVCFDAPLVSVIHDVALQVAQGQLNQLRLTIPANTVVTAVQAENLGAWRFDPTSGELEVRFSQPVTGDYRLQLVAQAAVSSVPYDFQVQPLVVRDAQHQSNLVGLVHTGEVFLDAVSKAQSINVDDFSRDAGGLIQLTPAGAAIPAYAYRLEGQTVAVHADAVRPELRVHETASFNVMDERLTYNGRLDVQIAKAGVFAVRLITPAAYDIDALTAQQLSHWDEAVEGERRVITAHFKQKTTGEVTLALAMSRPIAQLPEQLPVPRVELADSLRHTGEAMLRADRGLRLTVADRQGVTEVNPLELGVRDAGVLAFKLLKPNWSVTLQTEVIEPLINVETLHVARVSEGMVQHQHYLRYRLMHAGVKALTVRLPKDALGVAMAGPDIARRQQVESGLWRIELAKKWFDSAYPLQISYQSRFDRQAGSVAIEPVEAVGADQQRGHVVVYTTDRVELSPESVGPSLQAAEARGVPGQSFGAGDLSGAAFCYSASAPGYSLSFHAVRHASAVQVEADVRAADIRTVVTETGQSINYVRLTMSVGSKRYLRCWLPEGAQLWSLLVNARAAVPSRQVADGRSALLIPLAQAAAQNLDVQVDLAYVLTKGAKAWTGRQGFQGPRFDLPLKNIHWTFYLPEAYRYDDFGGALAPTAKPEQPPTVLHYDIQSYERSVRYNTITGNNTAVDYQKMAQRMAQQGQQYGAREILNQAANYSLSDASLNEDINVDLGNLLRQQAKVGLVAANGRLRLEALGSAGTTLNSSGVLDDQFKQQQAEQIESALSQVDNENLDLISRRMVETQQTAAGRAVQLLIELPERGRKIEFARPLLVQGDSPLELSFRAEPAVSQRVPSEGLWGLGLFALLSASLYTGGFAGRRLGQLRQRLSCSAPAAVGDDQPVSGEELKA